jgi:hypothetical protein
MVQGTTRQGRFVGVFVRMEGFQTVKVQEITMRVSHANVKIVRKGKIDF